jgi:hypothetical protein
MRQRRDSSTEGAGVRSGRAPDLRDTRQGTYGAAGNQTQEDLSDPTPRKQAQSGGAMQGDPIPAKNFQLPEGIKRQPMGPYNRGTRGEVGRKSNAGAPTQPGLRLISLTGRRERSLDH